MFKLEIAGKKTQSIFAEDREVARQNFRDAVAGAMFDKAAISVTLSDGEGNIIHQWPPMFNGPLSRP